MRELSSIELARLEKELKSIEGSRLRKFYGLGKDEFELYFYKAEQHVVYAKLLKTINLTSYTSEHEEASMFAMQIRKHLENRIVEKIYQHGTDRILIFDFSEFMLIFEMFGKGNLILVDNSFRIIAPYKRLEFKDRKTDYNEIYKFPASSSAGFVEKSEALEILKRLAVEKRDEKLISISKSFDYGPLYIENAITACNLKPSDKLGSISDDKLKELAERIANMKNNCMNSKAIMYINEHDYALERIIKYNNSLENIKEYPTLSSLLDDFYLSERGKEEASEEAKRKEAIAKSIEQQKELIKKFEDEEKRYAEIAKLILEHMDRLNLILSYAKSKKRFSIEELKQFENSIEIVGIDLKNKKIKVRIKE